MTARATPPFRADHVGSLLRPDELREARGRAARGDIDAAALRAVQDRCIREVVAQQEAVGLQSITDGEFRRDWWHIDFLRGFDGLHRRGLPPFAQPARPGIHGKARRDHQRAEGEAVQSEHGFRTAFYER